jgi:predicted RNase H-like HicB family nuclease
MQGSELRFEVLKLVHTHGKAIEEIKAQADSYFEWIIKDQKPQQKKNKSDEKPENPAK